MRTMTVDPQWDDDTEDQFKSSWDFWTPDGPVTTLRDLSLVTGQDEDSLARDLLRLPFGKAAPAELIAEAQARG